MDFLKKQIKFLPFWLFFLLGIAQTVYVFFLQVPGQVSLKRLVIALVLGGLALMSALFFVWRGWITTKNWRFLIPFSLFMTLVFLYVVPLPNHYLLGPRAAVEVASDNTGADNKEVLITWFNSGLADIRYADLDLTAGSYADEAGIHLVSAPGETAAANWSGTTWEHVWVEISAPYTDEIRITLNGTETRFSADYLSKNGGVARLTTQTDFGKFVLSMVVMVGGWFSTLYLLLLLMAAARWIKPKGAVVDNNQKLAATLERYQGAAVVLLAVVILFWLLISFSNPYYGDDYCYALRFAEHGWLGASLDSYQTLNGRFLGHLVNYAYVPLGDLNPKLGVLSAVIFLGGALYLFFNTLFRALRQEKHVFWALFSALAVFVFAYLLAPSIYDSLFWTLSGMLLLAGFVFFLLAAAVLIRKFLVEKRPVQPGWLLLFALLGIGSGGFIEAASVVLIAIAALVVLYFLIRQNRFMKRLWLLPAAYFVGAVTNLTLVLSAPGNQNRLESLGGQDPTNLMDILNRYVRLLADTTETVLNHNGIFLLFLVVAAVYVGNQFGKSAFSFLDRFTLFEKTVLIVLPFLLYAVALAPSAFVSGYLPARTVFIPIFILTFGVFLVSLGFGSRVSAWPVLNRVMPLMMIFVTVGLAWGQLTTLDTQMNMFVAEWEERQTEILTAADNGETEYLVRPYEYGFGTDLDNQISDWLDVCMDEYYGINLVVPGKASSD